MFFVSRDVAAQTAKSATPKQTTISIEQHRQELTQTLNSLRAWEKGAAPSLQQLQKAMPPEIARVVKRRDGATQKIRGNDWSNYIRDIEYSIAGTTRVRRQNVRELIKLFETRLRALNEWSRGNYQIADAQNIVRSLESSNAISTQPPRFLVWWQSAKDAVGDWFKRIFSWRAPTPTPPNTPQWKANPTWINFFFASTLAALLIAVAWWLWRTFGGRWTRNAARRDLIFSGEDAELLLLPPDELRARAERLAGEGHFGQALRHRYVAILLALDGQKVWRYDTRRTNWEHIGALKKQRASQTLVAPLSSLTERFDRVRYGELICAQLDWTRFAHDATALENLVSSTRSAQKNEPATPGVAA